jgi:hypothetical protein
MTSTALSRWLLKFPSQKGGPSISPSPSYSQPWQAAENHKKLSCALILNFGTCWIYIQSNLDSRTPWIMNNSVYEQIFRTQSASDDVLCLELRTRKPSTSWSDKLGVSASAVFVEEWSSGKYPESATPIGESVSCCVVFIHSNSLCLLLNFSVFCVFL